MKHRIDFEFQALNFLENAQDAARLAQQTPINKVPVLLEGDDKIFDSRVIMNYLIKKHELPALSLEDENRVSAIYSCMDTGVILFLMGRDGFDLNAPGFFLPRQRERIPRNLEYLAPWVRSLDPAKDDHWNYPAMSLYSFLYWAQARDLLRLSDSPEFAAFTERFKDAPGVRETSF